MCYALCRPGVNAWKTVFEVGFSLIYFEILQENEFCILFIIYFQTGFFHFNGFMDISFQDGFHLSISPTLVNRIWRAACVFSPGLIRIPLASFNSAHLHNKNAQCSLNPMIKTMLLF
jgi:hypothetical protein